MPSGWPIAIAPPLGLTRASSSASPRSRSTARPWAAKASFSSITSICASVKPVWASTLRTAGAGPKPMMRGATPAVAMPTMRAFGVKPCAPAAASEAIKSAQAPSLTPEALPAVTVNSGPLTPLSLTSISSVVSGRGCSSVSKTSGSPFLRGTSTGINSSAKRPAACAAAQRCCERSANASWSAREMLNSWATLSAVCGIECVS